MIPLSTGMHNYAVIMGSRSFCGCRDSRMQHVFHTWGKEANSLSFYVGERPPLQSNSNTTSLKVLRPYITELKGEPFLTLAKDYDYNIPILSCQPSKTTSIPPVTNRSKCWGTGARTCCLTSNGSFVLMTTRIYEWSTSNVCSQDSTIPKWLVLAKKLTYSLFAQ